jgi:hypothetical protein
LCARVCQEDSPSLRTEEHDRLIQHTLKLLIRGRGVGKAVSNPHQLKKRLPITLPPIVGQLEAFDSLFPTPPRFRFHLNRSLTTDPDHRRPVVESFNPEVDVAHPDRIPLTYPPRRSPDPNSIQVCAVHTCEVSDHPPLILKNQFGVASTDRCVIDNNFQIGQSADPEVGSVGPPSRLWSVGNKHNTC